MNVALVSFVSSRDCIRHAIACVGHVAGLTQVQIEENLFKVILRELCHRWIWD
jgi:hypothetical protein